MKLAVLERTFTPELAAPITYDNWMQVNHTLDGCLEARQVEWLYSLVSVNGDRSVCLFNVPYTETVRESCREARMPFQRVWQADLWMEQDLTSFPQGCSLVIAAVNFDPPMTKTKYEFCKQQAEGCFQELKIQPAFTAISLDGTSSICAFSATSAEAVRSLYRKVGQPFQQIWKAILIRPNTATLPPR
jgi:hypothetical protein